MTTERVSAEAGNAAAPAARRIPTERTHHGDTFIDEYAWLADKDNPETIAYLTAENAYTEAATASQAALRDEIFGLPARAAGGTTRERWRDSSTRCTAAGKSAPVTPGRR